MHIFSLIFLLALLAGLALQLWLLQRQGAEVRRHRQQVPEAFAARVTLEEHQKAADYSIAKLGLGRVELVLGAVFLLFLTFGGWLAWLDAFWQQRGLEGLYHGLAMLFSVILLSELLSLPLGIWRTFRLEQDFGFNHTTPRRFLLDLGLQWLLTFALGLPLLAMVLWLMVGAGQVWWLYAWALWLGFTLFLAWLYPVVIAPLFNRFTPLEDGELKTRIQALLDRCGFRSQGIFVMDGSRRSGHGNAYFTGFGKAKRIVFFDTLVERLTPEELEAVLAHELGHFKRRHVQKNLLVMAVVSLLGLALLGYLSGQTWFYTGLGLERSSPAGALILFGAAMPVFTIFFAPIGSLLSRRHEYEADDFAVAQTDGRRLIAALVKLYRDNAATLTPDRLFSAFYDSHPPAPVRIAHINNRLG